MTPPLSAQPDALPSSRGSSTPSQTALFAWDRLHFVGRPFRVPRPMLLRVPPNDPLLSAQPSRRVGAHRHLSPPHRAGAISIVCNFRDAPEITLRCLAAIARQKFRERAEVILVNNQSTPTALNQIRQQAAVLLPSARFEVIHVDFDAPFNHSAQCNLAARTATGNTLIMLNNDAIILDATVLQEIADWAHTPGVATAGPRIVGDAGRLVSAGIEVVTNHKTGQVRIRESECLPLSKEIRHTAGNSFCCCAIRKEVWESVGGLREELFPSQYNDADFLIRCLDKGMRHIYIGQLSVFHEPGKSEARTIARVEAIHSRLVELHPHLATYQAEAPALVPLVKFKRPPGPRAWIRWNTKRALGMMRCSERALRLLAYRKVVALLKPRH